MANNKYEPKTKQEFNAYRQSKEDADVMVVKSASDTAKRLAAQGLTVKAGKVVPITKTARKAAGKKK